MNSFYSISKKNFKNNPKKIFFYDFNDKFTGETCLKNLNFISNFLKKNKINSIGINCENSIYWPVWYLSATKSCKDVFILNPN